jgi:hypothetical protein
LEEGVGMSNIPNWPALFAIVGCVVYTFAETERGETGFRIMLGRNSGGKIVGLQFIEGLPQPYSEPISPELLAKGYPTVPPNIGLLQPGDLVFRAEDEGNYAR